MKTLVLMNRFLNNFFSNIRIERETCLLSKSSKSKTSISKYTRYCIRTKLLGCSWILFFLSFWNAWWLEMKPDYSPKYSIFSSIASQLLIEFNQTSIYEASINIPSYIQTPIKFQIMLTIWMWWSWRSNTGKNINFLKHPTQSHEKQRRLNIKIE